MAETQIISDRNDFPHVQVLRTDTTSGPILRIGFKNREPRPAGPGILVVLLSVVPLAVIIWMLANPPDISGDAKGYLLLVMIGAELLLFVCGTILLIVPQNTRRLIELDFPADTFRVKRKDKTTVERPLKRLHGLAVEPHPDAEYKRHKRMNQGDRALSKEEKMHCLVGYFGYEGAERVDLVSRLEWPNRNSLIEVQRAIFFANDKAGGAPVKEEEVIHGEDGMSMRGIKPPLD